jgi:hypothetical protein
MAGAPPRWVTSQRPVAPTGLTLNAMPNTVRLIVAVAAKPETSTSQSPLPRRQQPDDHHRGQFDGQGSPSRPNERE